MRGHPELNWGPLDLQSNALPLSYTPMTVVTWFCFKLHAVLLRQSKEKVGFDFHMSQVSSFKCEGVVTNGTIERQVEVLVCRRHPELN